MEDVCNSALYCLHSVFSQPQPRHGKEGPISAAGGGAIQYYSFSCVVSCMHTAEVNDSDPHCRRNGYILHIYVLSAKKPQKKRQDMHHHHTVLVATEDGSLLPLVTLLIQLKKQGLQESPSCCMMNFQEVEKMTQG